MESDVCSRPAFPELLDARILKLTTTAKQKKTYLRLSQGFFAIVFVRSEISSRESELFDVVDALDRAVSTASRAEVHRRGLFHRAIHVFVFDDKGRLLLQQRSLSKDSAPGLWCSSCSGHVDAGEEYLSAAVRELSEEIGLSVSAMELEEILRVSPCLETGWEFARLYLLCHDGPFVADPSEISEIRSISSLEIDKLLDERAKEFSASFAHLFRLSRLLLRAG